MADMLRDTAAHELASAASQDARRALEVANETRQELRDGLHEIGESIHRIDQTTSDSLQRMADTTADNNRRIFSRLDDMGQQMAAAQGISPAMIMGIVGAVIASVGVMVTATAAMLSAMGAIGLLALQPLQKSAERQYEHEHQGGHPRIEARVDTLERIQAEVRASIAPADRWTRTDTQTFILPTLEDLRDRVNDLEADR